MERLRESKFFRAWLAIDPRTLGLLRIAIGLLLLGDLLRRLPDFRLWYTDFGLLPASAAADRFAPSFFFFLHTPAGAALGLLACGLVYLAYLFGYRTRLAQVLALVCVVSLHNRVILLENGGDVAMGLLVMWTTFLPLGRRFSLDSLRRSMGDFPESRVEDLARRPPADVSPVVSVAVFGLLLQIAVIYFFNAAHKWLPWASSDVIHYVLWQSRIVTPLGLFVRHVLPVWGDRLLASTTLVVESMTPWLVLSPWARVDCRRAAMLLVPPLHAGMALLMNVGFFSPTMMVYFVSLVSPEDWEALYRRFRNPRRALTVFFDASCGICFQTVRVLSRLDAYGLLEFVPNTDESRLPRDLEPGILERTVVVVDASGKRTTRHQAFAEMLDALPWGRAVSWTLRFPGLSAIAGAAYDAVARNRQRISGTLGLAACGLPLPPPSPEALEPAAPPVPRRRIVLPLGRELAVGVMVLATGSQVLVENQGIPPLLKVQGQTLATVVESGRFFQGWSMFAPTPPLRDGMVVVDALTVSGRHVDPLNAAAIGWTGPPAATLPDRLGQDEFFCDYENRVAFAGRHAPALREFVLSYDARTGDPSDKVVSFEASWIEAQSPPPGSKERGLLTRKVFLRYPETPPPPPRRVAGGPG